MPDTSRPPAPSNVSVTGSGTDSVSLTWTPVPGHRATTSTASTSPRSGGQPLGILATAQPITATSYTDIGLASSSRYYYVVTAIVGRRAVAGLGRGDRDDDRRSRPADPRQRRAALTTRPRRGASWRADAFFTGGNLKSVTTPISGTTDQALYQDERWGQFSYAIPVANGVYDVRFHFVELYYGTSQPGSAGKRVFGVDIGSTSASPDLSNIDIYNAVGPNAAYVRTISGVNVTNGILSIQSVYGCCDDPELAALEIIPEPTPPTVSLTVPSSNAVGISPYVAPHATFSRGMNASTITASSFTLRSSSGNLVPATVSYDSMSRTAVLTPNAPLALSTEYTARLDSTIAASDGTPLTSAITWSFTTAGTVPSPPTVTATNPADGATSIAQSATVQATFSTAMNPSTIAAGSFTLAGPSGAVAGTVTYDLASQTATLTPSSPLAYSTQYTATLSTSILASDGTPLATTFSWAFTTLDPPPPPTVTGVTPTNGSTYVSRTAVATATFSRPMDPMTISPTTFTLRGPDGNLLSATVSYSASTNTATLTPNQTLADNADFTAQLDTNVKSADGVALASADSWSFATSACPCTLFPMLTVPASQNNPTQDGRVGIGPWSRELGVKIAADEPMQINTVRFYKSSKETGTHVGTIWTTSGFQLAQITFVGETASGWQEQALPTPLPMTPGVTYIVSVNANAYFGLTQNALLTQAIGGPLRSIADGMNGVFSSAAGIFPTSTYRSSNYFVDVSTSPTGDPVPPSVQSTAPASSAAGVVRTTTVQATFSRPLAPTTVTSSRFTLNGPGGSVPAAVSYNDATSTAILTPSSPLSYSTTYTATVSGAVRARDGVPLGTPVSWSFTVADAVPPTVTSTVPAAGAADIGSTAAPRAQFSKSIKASTLTTSTFTLTGPSGAVTGNGRLRRLDAQCEVHAVGAASGRVVHRPARRQHHGGRRRNARNPVQLELPRRPGATGDGRDDDPCRRRDERGADAHGHGEVQPLDGPCDDQLLDIRPQDERRHRRGGNRHLRRALQHGDAETERAPVTDGGVHRNRDDGRAGRRRDSACGPNHLELHDNPLPVLADAFHRGAFVVGESGAGRSGRRRALELRVRGEGSGHTAGLTGRDSLLQGREGDRGACWAPLVVDGHPACVGDVLG